MEHSFDAFIVLNEKNTDEVHMIRDGRGNDGLAIYPFEARGLDEDGEPFSGTRVVPCKITYTV